jgi:arsenical pump membrane protein
LRDAAAISETATALGAGGLIAIVCNAINNLPAGLIAHSVSDAARAPQRVVDSLLIGVDLGPNLAVTGSLATVLWLGAIRREGENVNFGRFLRVGILVMPPALVLALCARALVR